MKKMKIFLALLAVSSLCLCFAGCNYVNKSQTATPSTDAADEQKSVETEKQIKYILYCGLNDATEDTQVLEVGEAQDIARDIIIDKGLGYTEYVTFGAYTEGSDVKENDTIVYELLFAEKDDVIAVADEIKTELNLASVLIEEVESEYYFAE